MLGKRIVTVDILRGFFIFMIIVDHLGMFPNGFDLFTGRGFLWVSAAEGFFFISGMMIGIIRGRKDINKPIKEISVKLLKRSLILYGWTIALTVFFTSVAMITGPNSGLKDEPWQGSFVQMLWHDITLQYVYSWADFLRYYSVYLAISVIAVILLRKKLAWAIGLLSIVTWLFGRNYTMFFTWQLLFFGGVLAGWYFNEIIIWAKKLPKLIVAFHYPLTILLISLSVLTVYGPFNDLRDQLSPYYSRQIMPPLRIGMFFLWFSALYRFVSSHEDWIEKRLGKFLIPFGQNSLYVYILHSFIVFFIHLIIPNTQGFVINFIVTVFTLAVIWYAVHRRFLFKFIPR